MITIILLNPHHISANRELRDAGSFGHRLDLKFPAISMDLVVELLG